MAEKKEYKEFYTPGAIILGALMIAGSILYAANPSAFRINLSAPRPSGSNVPSNHNPSSGSAISIPVSVSDHIRGNPSASTTIVEFSDLQCPFCKAFHPTLSRALQEYGNKVRWVYKQFPLEQIHPQARAAAEASECVWEQKGNDGFWKFADSVFEGQSRIGPDLFKEVAANLGVNMDVFNSCVSSRKYKDKVQADLDLGLKIGVDGTPASFVNGVVVRGAVPYAQVKQAIDSQLAK